MKLEYGAAAVALVVALIEELEAEGVIERGAIRERLVRTLEMAVTDEARDAAEGAVVLLGGERRG